MNELKADNDNKLTSGLVSLMRDCKPVYETHFGLISKPADNSGRYYLVIEEHDDSLSICTGLYSIDGHMGRCHCFDGKWEVSRVLLESLFNDRSRLAVPVSVWEHDSIPLTVTVPAVTIDEMNNEIRDYISDGTVYEFFYTDDWSPAFYRAQAKLGFIAVSDYCDGSVRLMPQLQNFYAVIDWPNLTADKKVRKIIKSGRLSDEDIKLNIDSDPGIILEKLVDAWAPSTWLYPKYIDLIKQLASAEEMKNDDEFRIWGVTLTVGREKHIAAGELGYSVGRTYTSLSGYFDRSKKEYSNFGKLQMILLAEVLQNASVAFWNLGHPFMDYKYALGAQILPRNVFLERWDEAAAGESADLSRQQSF